MKRSWFYRIYAAVVAVFLAALGVGLWQLWGWLGRYEAAQPQTVADAAVADTLGAGHFSALRERCAVYVPAYQDDAALDAALAALTKGHELTAVTSARRVEGCDTAYAVMAGDRRVCYLYLKRNAGDEGQFSLAGYTLVGAEPDASLYREYHLRMPADAAVAVGGTPLTDKDRTDLPLPTVGGAPLSPEGAVPRQTCTLRLIGGCPEITAFAGDKPLVVEPKADGFAVLDDFEGREAAGAFALEAVQTYARYMMLDAPLSAVSGYFDTRSEIYRNMATSQVKWAPDHTGYRFDNARVGDYHHYSDSVVCCRVTVDQVLLRGKKEYVEAIDKTVYLRRHGGDYRVIDMQSPAEANA